MATYFVATPANGGSDSNPGTQVAPKATVSAGCALLTQPGDTLFIRGGTYPNTFACNPAASGTQQAPITIQNFEGEPIILDAGATANGQATRPIFEINNRQWLVFRGDPNRGFTLRNGSDALIYLGRNGTSSNILVEWMNLGKVWKQDNAACVYVNLGGGNIVRRSWLRPDNHLVGVCGVIAFRGDNNLIVEHCEVSEAHNALFYKHGTAQDTNGPKVRWRYNRIFSCDIAIQSSTDNVIVEHTLIYDCSGYAARFGENGGPGSNEDCVMDHVTMVNCPGGIWYRAQGDGDAYGSIRHALTNSIMYDCADGSPPETGLALWIYVSSGSPVFTADYNLYGAPNTSTLWRRLNQSYSSLAAWQAALGGSNEQHSIHGTPTFVDPSNKNFALAPGSLGKNAASDGTDMGADLALVGPEGGLDGGEAQELTGVGSLAAGARAGGPTVIRSSPPPTGLVRRRSGLFVPRGI